MSQTVYLKVPTEPQYCNLVRLVSSGIANELGFSFEEINQIKYVISEICHYMRSFSTQKYQELEFKIFEDKFQIILPNYSGQNKKQLNKMVVSLNLNLMVNKIKIGKKIILEKRVCS